MSGVRHKSSTVFGCRKYPGDLVYNEVFLCKLSVYGCLWVFMVQSCIKDRDHGTTGPKEGLSPIGRFGLKGQILFQFFWFLENIYFLRAQMILINI